MRVNRRVFLGGAALAPLIANPARVLAAERVHGVDVSDWRPRTDAWATAPAILKRIAAPQFPANDFNITDYGALSDGAADCTAAIRAAIAACVAAGGGRVVVPAGVYACGPIHLKSNVNLHLAKGAILRFSTDPADYLPLVHTRFEGVELMNYSPAIYALDAENVAVTGKGVLDGQADVTNWWPWKRRPAYGWAPGEPNQHDAVGRLSALAREDTPVEERVFGPGGYLRSSFVQPYRCKNVLIEGVTVTGAPMWCLHPVLCENVIVRGVTVSSHGPNNDGCNPECCRDVLIKDCVFDTGDDCIAVKSGRNEDARRVGRASENIIVDGCVMKDGHGGVVIGSEISGDVRNVFVQNCHMSSPNLLRAVRIKTNARRGGLVENVHVRRISVGEVSQDLVRINLVYPDRESGDLQPVVRNVSIEDVACEKAPRLLDLVGLPDAPITDVRLRSVYAFNIAGDSRFEHVEGLSIEDVFVDLEPPAPEVARNIP